MRFALPGSFGTRHGVFRLYSWYLVSFPHRSSADFSRMGIPLTLVSNSVTKSGEHIAATDTPAVAFALSATPATPNHATISPK